MPHHLEALPCVCRLWWQNHGVFTRAQKTSLASVSLARIICDNTGIGDVPSNPFIFRPRGSGYIKCDDIPPFDLRPWLETGEWTLEMNHTFLCVYSPSQTDNRYFVIRNPITACLLPCTSAVPSVFE